MTSVTETGPSLIVVPLGAQHSDSQGNRIETNRTPGLRVRTSTMSADVSRASSFTRHSNASERASVHCEAAFSGPARGSAALSRGENRILPL